MICAGVGTNHFRAFRLVSIDLAQKVSKSRINLTPLWQEITVMSIPNEALQKVH